MSATAPLRVVLVDDHEMILHGLKAMLAPFHGRVRVVGESIGADDAMQVVAACGCPKLGSPLVTCSFLTSRHPA